MWTTWANLLTGLRLVSIVPCVYGVWAEYWVVAALSFAVAAVSDFLDGRIARRYQQVTTFGGLFDHATDAIFVSVVLGTLALTGEVIPIWLPILIPMAFVQYTLDSNALSGQHLRASWLGRNNGIAYFVLTGIPVIRNGLGLDWPVDSVISLLAWVLVVTTVISMLDRGVAWFSARQT